MARARTQPRLLPMRGWRGFTLIELLVVVAVIAILASMTAPMMLDAIKKSQKAKCGSNLNQLGSGMVLYGGAFATYLPPFGYYYTPEGSSSPYQSPWWTETITDFLRNRAKTGNADSSVIRCPSWTGTWSAKFLGITCNFGDIFRYYTPASLSSTVFHGPGSLQMTAINKPSKTYFLMDGRTTFCYSASCWARVDDWDGDGILDTKAGTACIYGGGAPFRHQGRCNMLFADGHVTSIRSREWLTEVTAWDPYQ